jgi:methionine aminopeptidase
MCIESQADFDGIRRELSGHGVGRTIHKEPTVKNYDDPRQREVLTDLAAPYEHTVIVTRGAPVIVTSLSRSA